MVLTFFNLADHPGGIRHWLLDACHGRIWQLEPGTVLVLPPDSDGSIRASQVGRLSFSFFCVDPMRLMGLLTLAEQSFFRLAASQEEFVRPHSRPATSFGDRVAGIFRKPKTNRQPAPAAIASEIHLKIFGE